jgi:hypothetical protein
MINIEINSLSIHIEESDNSKGLLLLYTLNKICQYLKK